MKQRTYTSSLQLPRAGFFTNTRKFTSGSFQITDIVTAKLLVADYMNYLIPSLPKEMKMPLISSMPHNPLYEPLYMTMASFLSFAEVVFKSSFKSHIKKDRLQSKDLRAIDNLSPELQFFDVVRKLYSLQDTEQESVSQLSIRLHSWIDKLCGFNTLLFPKFHRDTFKALCSDLRYLFKPYFDDSSLISPPTVKTAQTDRDSGIVLDTLQLKPQHGFYTGEHSAVSPVNTQAQLTKAYQMIEREAAQKLCRTKMTSLNIAPYLKNVISSALLATLDKTARDFRLEPTLKAIEKYLNNAYSDLTIGFQADICAQLELINKKFEFTIMPINITPQRLASRRLSCLELEVCKILVSTEYKLMHLDWNRNNIFIDNKLVKLPDHTRHEDFDNKLIQDIFKRNKIGLANIQRFLGLVTQQSGLCSLPAHFIAWSMSKVLEAGEVLDLVNSEDARRLSRITTIENFPGKPMTYKISISDMRKFRKINATIAQIDNPSMYNAMFWSVVLVVTLSSDGSEVIDVKGEYTLAVENNPYPEAIGEVKAYAKAVSLPCNRADLDESTENLRLKLKYNQEFKEKFPA